MTWVALALASPYEAAHRDATRRILVYRQGSTALLMRATLVSPALQEAMVLERTRLLGSTPQAEQTFRETLTEALSDVVEVVFAADSALERRPRFGRGDDRWAVHLYADGVDLPLQTVERVDKPTPLQASLYPQWNRWSELWVARFEPPAVPASTLRWTVGSGFGHGEATWVQP